MTERERFDNILRETGRRGIENVLFELDKLGFYSAPASTRFHGSYPGGLLKHSLNVYDEAMMVLELQLRQRSGIEHLIPVCSIAIAALLHDVCKRPRYIGQRSRNARMHWACGNRMMDMVSTTQISSLGMGKNRSLGFFNGACR